MESVEFSDVYRPFPDSQPITSFKDASDFFTQQARWLFEPEQLIELRVLDWTSRSGTSMQNGYPDKSAQEGMFGVLLLGTNCGHFYWGLTSTVDFA